MKPFMPSG
ncbi:unnamed protein product [Discula destructiva]